MELTAQELQQLSFFLTKCTLTGDQSLAHAQLVIKINQALQSIAEQQQAAQRQASA
ncbi:hypothetical protein LCGC14_2784110 [marine sediment metagenome]|uniref:Uncharacterized protein n=1 Tax=marine sediment metagenome TaxID=412755 RepID=A0A0F9BIZ9_9ZZZZ